MSLILNIETSSENCSVAISKDEFTLDMAEEEGSKSHASVLTVLIDELLRKNQMGISDLDAIAVSKGPGSYTGLRIGVSVAKGLCYGAVKPLIAINTLDSMMNGFRKGITDFEIHFTENTIFCPMLDARRLEVYLAMYDKKGVLIKETTAEIIDENSFSDILKEHPMVFFGSGTSKCKEILKNPNAQFMDHFLLKASYMTHLSYENLVKRNFENVAYFEPFYLKDFVATIPKRKVI